MNNDLFFQTAKQIDMVDVYLCCKLYDICNDNMIAGTTRSNFVCWMNLRPTEPAIQLLPREKTRFSYFVKVVSEHLLIKQFKNEWIDAMLVSCDVPRAHYDKHNFEVPCNKHAAKNKELVDGLSQAFEEASSLLDH